MTRKLIFVFFFLGLTYLTIINYSFIKEEINRFIVRNGLTGIKEKILFISQKNKKILELEKKLLNAEYSISRMDLEESYHALYEFHSKYLENSFAIKKKSIIQNIEGVNFSIDYYSIDNLFNGKHISAKATIYLEKTKNNVIIATGDGHFFYINNDDLNKDIIKLNKLKTNIHELISDIDFITKSDIGIKDILIDNEDILLTIPMNKKKCYSLAIFKSRFNYENIKFNKFFETKECEDFSNKNSNHFGGRIKVIDKNHYVFTTGDFGNSSNAQLKKNLFGKIVKLNRNTKNTEIISIGHRNQQGLYYDKEKNIILSTEHGPTGGDEINLINLNDNNFKNYGWPRVSYGIDANAAWKNNHMKSGYIEPIKYYVPSIAISEIVKMPKSSLDGGVDEYFVAAMGGISDGGYQSIHLIALDKQNEVYGNEKFIKINDRVRDLLAIDELNIVLGSTEINPGFIKISKIR